ncbi:hypothetical protein PUG81_04970 [Erwiniaceae bacterium L1_54_6]|nr:hypothetical protein [Erwiniaceae bacterium L1_54_6]
MSKVKNRIKKPQQEVSNTIAVPHEFKDPAEQRPPEFSLRYLQNGYCIDSCQQEDKAALADKMFRLSKLTWAQIKQQDRHGLGCEKLTRNTIKAAIPAHVTEDATLLAFRFNGMAPMVGYRREATFFILWLDRSFTLYNH